MRHAGAQSGGVVTFEPTHYRRSKSNTTQSTSSTTSSTMAPSLRGIRTRVVNAKRTDLSKRLRRKLVKDNGTLLGNLRGWNKSEYINVNQGGGRLIRGFFGHTRFATSSKASLDGTHPHQWSERRNYKLYPFGSGSSSDSLSRSSRSMGVENHITHNGDFEFFKVNGKYYDVEVIQQWLGESCIQRQLS